MRRTDHPAAEQVVGKPVRQAIEVNVVHNGPHAHGAQHGKQGDDVQGNQHHNPH